MIYVYIQQHANVKKGGEYKDALCLSITQYIWIHESEEQHKYIVIWKQT